MKTIDQSAFDRVVELTCLIYAARDKLDNAKTLAEKLEAKREINLLTAQRTALSRG